MFKKLAITVALSAAFYAGNAGANTIDDAAYNDLFTEFSVGSPMPKATNEECSKILTDVSGVTLFYVANGTTFHIAAADLFCFRAQDTSSIKVIATETSLILRLQSRYSSRPDTYEMRPLHNDNGASGEFYLYARDGMRLDIPSLGAVVMKQEMQRRNTFVDAQIRKHGQ